MTPQPLPEPVRIISSNVLPVPKGFNEPAVENKQETLETLSGWDGNVKRTFFSTQEFPAINDVPLPVAEAADSGVCLVNGTNVFYLDIAPGFETPIHRTVSTDYIFVHSGTPTHLTPKRPFNVVDGKADITETEETVLKEGQLLVQRGQAHGWKNATDSWVRLLCFVVHAKETQVEVEVGEGKETKGLGEIWL
jgi:quercetin dioxygenase-like cupin family protein